MLPGFPHMDVPESGTEKKLRRKTTWTARRLHGMIKLAEKESGAGGYIPAPEPVIWGGGGNFLRALLLIAYLASGFKKF